MRQIPMLGALFMSVEQWDLPNRQLEKLIARVGNLEVGWAAYRRAADQQRSEERAAGAQDGPTLCASCHPRVWCFIDQFEPRDLMTVRAWGGLVQASTNIGGFQSYSSPSVAVLENGTFVVTWTRWPTLVGTSRVDGQRFDADGTRLGVGLQPTYPPIDHINEGYSTVAALSGGGFVVGFEHGFDGDQSDHTDPVFQLFDASGTGSPARHVDGDFAPYSSNVPEFANLVVARFETGFVVAYHDPNSNAGDIALDIRNTSGDDVAHISVVNSITAGDQRLPDVAEIGGGISLWPG